MHAKRDNGVTHIECVSADGRSFSPLIIRLVAIEEAKLREALSTNNTNAASHARVADDGSLLGYVR